MQPKIMLLFNLSENGNFTIKKFKFLYKNSKFDEVIDVSAIHLLLLKQKYEISTVDCTQIKDLNNLCVRPTIACKQAKLGLDSFR